VTPPSNNYSTENELKTLRRVLSRLYRDVRAGSFMRPFGEYEIAEYLGKSTLGITPAIDR